MMIKQIIQFQFLLMKYYREIVVYQMKNGKLIGMHFNKYVINLVPNDFIFTPNVSFYSC